MTIIAGKGALLSDGHPLKGTQNVFGANHSVSSSNALPKEPALPPQAKAEGVPVSGASRTVMDATANPRRATLHLPPQRPRGGPTS